MRPEKILQFSSVSSGKKILEFATLDYLRKYLVGEPMLAQAGQPGWDPSVEAEVNAAAKHRPRLTPRKEKMVITQEKTKFKPRKGYKTAPAGRDIVADVEGNVPGTSPQSIKQGIFKSMHDITHEPEPHPAPPPDVLKGPGGKIPYDPDVVMKGGHPHVPDLFDITEAAKPTTVKFTPNRTLRKRPQIPRNEAERLERRKQVSAHAEKFRDPEASHLARVEHGLTPDLRQEYKGKIPGVPSFRLNPVRAEQEVHRAQGIRDILAKKGWAYRKNLLTPLRAHVRETQGLAPVAPLSKTAWKRLIPELRFAVKIKPNINIGGKEFHPTVLRALQHQFEKDLGKRLNIHKTRSVKIREGIRKRVGESTLPLEKGREIEQGAMDTVNKHFDPGRTEPINKLDAAQIAAFTGHSVETVETLHKAFRKHTELGETQLGEDKLRKLLFPRALKKVPAYPIAPTPGSNDQTKLPILRNIGIGAGAVGAVGAGAYLVHKLKQRKKREALQLMSARARLIRFQQVEDAYYDPTPWHKKEARRWLLYPESRSRALYQGASRAGKLVSDIRAPKSESGMIIGERGRERQPEWQKPWFRRTLITTGIVGTALAGRHVYGKLKKASAVAAGAMEAGKVVTETERAAANLTSGNWARALAKKFPRTSSAFSSASTRAGGLRDRFKSELKSLKEGTAKKINQAVEGEVGPITGGKLRKTKEGVKVEWDNPAYMKEGIAEAQKIQEQGKRKTASGVAKEERMKKSGKTRKTMEEELKNLSSRLRLIRFEDPDLVRVGGYSRGPVPVREHYRGPRGYQSKSRDKRLREGFLLGAGGTATAAGSYLGARWGWNKYTQRLSKEEAAKKTIDEVESILKKRPYATKAPVAAAAKTARKVVSIAAQSKIEPIRFSALQNLRNKIDDPKQEGGAVHDVVTGAIEGGLAYPASAYLYKKLIGEGMPSTLKKVAVGGIVGGLATGLVGVGVANLRRAREKIKRREHKMRSRLRLIQFDQRNQRMLVARDRYTKQVHEKDIERADKLYAKAGLLGAGIGVLRKPSTFKASALKGALAGVGIQKLARMYGASTRDQFGERSVSGKRVERAPEWIGTAVLGGHVLKRMGFFSSRSRPIHFENAKWVDNPLYPDTVTTTVKDVPIKHIVSHQDAVKEHIVKKYKKNPSRSLPVLHKVGKKYYVEDGNHRIVSKIEKGETTVRAKVMEMGARLREVRFQDEFRRPKPAEPTAQLRNVAIGAGLVGVGYGGLQLGHAAREWRKIAPQVKDAADTISGSKRIGKRALRWLRSKLHLQSKLKEIRFEESKRKHNVGAGLLVASAGLPLYKGAGKFARVGLRSRIDQFAGRPMSHGKQVADYLEASQHVLNQGVTGKLVGAALRNPSHPVVKKALKLVPAGPRAELGSVEKGINKVTQEHFSSFREPTEGMQAWVSELMAHKPAHSKVNESRYLKLQDQLSQLTKEGYNERQALRHAARNPEHEKLFRPMMQYKSSVVPNYTKVVAGAAAIPATAGLAVAATTRKNKSASGGAR
jgi:hypothetical protein